MSIKFENKPSAHVVKELSLQIARLLAAHPITIEIQLRDHPIRLTYYVNNLQTGSENRWVENVIAHYHPLNKKVQISLFNNGIEDGMNDTVIWNEAYHIQNEVFNALNLNCGAPGDNNPYWELWNHIKIVRKHIV